MVVKKNSTTNLLHYFSNKTRKEMVMETFDLPSMLLTLGYKVEENGNHVEIRLPLYCSIHVKQTSNDRLGLEPYFGICHRTTATWLQFGSLISTLLLWLFLIDSDTKLAIAAITIFCSGFFWDVYRYILTEATIMQVRILLASKDRARFTTVGKD